MQQDRGMHMPSLCKTCRSDSHARRGLLSAGLVGWRASGTSSVGHCGERALTSRSAHIAQHRHGVTADGGIEGYAMAFGLDDARLHSIHPPHSLHMRTPPCGPVYQAGTAMQTAGARIVACVGTCVSPLAQF